MRVVALAALVACGSPKSPEPDGCTLDYPGPAIVPVESISIVRTADMDRDGHMDLVVVNPLRVFLGDGHGSFRELDSVPNLQAGTLLVADFNDDGIPDAFTIDTGNRNRVFFGSGTGAFGSSLEIANGFGSSNNLFTTDVDGDGHQDILGSVGTGIVIAWGRGDGSFTAPAGSAITGSFSSPVVADIDGDGRRDLIVVEGANVHVYMNQGDRKFVAGALIPSGLQPTSSLLAVADLDADGDPDLVVSDGNASVVLPNVGGTLGPPSVRLDRGGIVQIVDMDGDHRPDIIVSDPFGRWTYRNLGASTFAAAVKSTVQGNLVDIDGNGYPDVVSTLSFGVAITLDRGDGTLIEPEVRPTSAAAFSIVAGDVDGDGVADLVMGSDDVLLANGGTKLASDVIAASDSPALALGNMNGDGMLDLVEGVSTGIVSMHGRGDGTFAKAALAAMEAPLQLVLADLDGDGVDDIAAVYATQGLSQGTTILLNRGDGVLLPRIDVATGSSLSIAAGDVDGDGRVDLVVTTGERGNPMADFAIVVLANLGAGRFEPAFRMRLPEPMRVAVADIDRDGQLDLVLFGSTVSILRGAPFPRRFFDPTSYVLGPSAPVFAGAVADLDGDGWPEVLASLQSGSVAILRNVRGALDPPRLYRTNGTPVALAVADLDGDGQPDIATTDVSASAVTVLPARCSRQ